MFEPFDETASNRYESMSVEGIIDEALTRLDAVILTPEQARDILDYRLSMLSLMLEDEDFEPGDFVNDEEFVLSEIANGEGAASFGITYRKYHISSKDLPFMGGVRETSLAIDLEGSIWAEIEIWKRASEILNRRKQE